MNIGSGCLVFVSICLISSASGATKPNPCVAALPTDGKGAVYNTMRYYSSDDVKFFLDEYAYEQNWKTHDEALSVGLQLAYGEKLRAGGTFDKSTKDQWFAEHESIRQQRFSQLKLTALEIKQLDPSIIRELGRSCTPIGPWTDHEDADACKFQFSAGYRSDGHGEIINPLKLTVTGGKCDQWPQNLPLSSGGDTVTCHRSGGDAVSISLLTKEKGTISDIIRPKATAFPPEPTQIQRDETGLTTQLTLTRFRDFSWAGANMDCPSGACKNLYRADFSTGIPNTVITSAQYIGCSPGESCGHWYRCAQQAGQPGSAQCAPVTQELSTLGNAHVQCANTSSCSIWRASDDGTNNDTVIKLTYAVKKTDCQNCPPGVDFDNQFS